MKNYTSSVPVERTIARIEQILAKAGASDVLKQYENGTIVAISFSIQNPYDSAKKLMIRLPANPSGVFSVLKEQVRRPQRDTLIRLKDQSLRTAWKIVQEWIEIQISMIEMKQAEFLQVFLPYICVTGKTTFYNQLRDSGFKLLGPGKGE